MEHSRMHKLLKMSIEIVCKKSEQGNRLQLQIPRSYFKQHQRETYANGSSIKCCNKLALIIQQFFPFRYITKYLFNKVFLNVQKAPSICPTNPQLSSSCITPPPPALPCKGIRASFRMLQYFSVYLSGPGTVAQAFLSLMCQLM